jgi:NAD(P)-dependent dehydrogenase (short-subunit alcohol dehydrogenase family)
LDVLVLNAGVSKAATIADYKPEDLDNLFATNVRGPFFLMQQLLPILAVGHHGEFYYEWEVLNPEEKRRKITKPWAVALKDNRLFSFGGIWASGTGGRIEPPAMSWKALPSEQWTRMSS